MSLCSFSHGRPTFQWKDHHWRPPFFEAFQVANFQAMGVPRCFRADKNVLMNMTPDPPWFSISHGQMSCSDRQTASDEFLEFLGQHSWANFQEWPANLLHEWISSLNPYPETPHCWVETITFYVHHFRFWLHGCQSPIQTKVHKDRPCSALSQTKPLVWLPQFWPLIFDVSFTEDKIQSSRDRFYPKSCWFCPCWQHKK